jgi:hypothetical protein
VHVVTEERAAAAVNGHRPHDAADVDSDRAARGPVVHPDGVRDDLGAHARLRLSLGRRDAESDDDRECNENE